MGTGEREGREAEDGVIVVRRHPKIPVARRQCPCGGFFDVFADKPLKAHCNRSCGMKYRTKEERQKGRELALKHRMENLEAEFEGMTKRQAWKKGWTTGYATARWAYHYRRFMRRLLEALDAHLAKSDTII